MTAKNLIWILFSTITLFACNPSRHEMPITTCSAEAKQLFIEGRDLKENVNYKQADSVLSLAIQIDPDFALAYIYLSKHVGLENAKALSNKVSIGERLMIKAFDTQFTGNIPESLSAIDSLIGLYPKDKHCVFFASMYYWFSQKLEKALELSKKAIDLDPYYSAAFNLLAYELMELERYEEAKMALEEYLDLWLGSNSNTIDSYGECLLANGEFREAIKEFERLLHIDPAMTFSYCKIVWLYIYLDEFDKARSYCEKLYRTRPDEEGLVKEKVWAFLMMANIHFIKGDLNEALDTMDRLIHMADTLNQPIMVVKGWLYKGRYSMRAGDLKHGIDNFNTGLKLLSKTSHVLNNPDAEAMRLHGGLCIAYGEAGMLDSSRFHQDQAKSFFSLLSPITQDMNLMKTYESVFAIANGDYDLAISELSPIKQLGTPWRFYLAKAYELKGDKQLAIKHYRKTSQQLSVHGYFYNESKQKLQELAE